MAKAQLLNLWFLKAITKIVITVIVIIITTNVITITTIVIIIIIFFSSYLGVSPVDPRAPELNIKI